MPRARAEVFCRVGVEHKVVCLLALQGCDSASFEMGECIHSLVPSSRASDRTAFFLLKPARFGYVLPYVTFLRFTFCRLFGAVSGKVSSP